jgi:broad specificity phosphatase PhoE
LGLRQGEVVRDALARLHLHACYTSPLRRAMQTAAVLAAPHGLTPVVLEALTECDVGLWEGLCWQQVQQQWPEDFLAFQADPWNSGYPGGESLSDVFDRVAAVLDGLLRRHEGETIVVVSHHVVLRVWLAALLGLPGARTREVALSNASISVVVRHGTQTIVECLNDVGHLLDG